MSPVNLDKQLEYMYGLERFGIKLGLEIMEALLAQLGNPHGQFKSIHITGTNGKGSTAAMLESVLRAAGFTTALYTSPHLFTFNERIRINNQPISDQELSQLIVRVKTAAERARIQPTFFEFTTAVAFCYFAAHAPDIAIIEVGMGGLLDATNVVTPLVSVITNVDLDHVPALGNNRQEIAANKAGIIKDGVPVVTSETDPTILTYLQSVAKDKNTYLRVTSELTIELKRQSYDGQEFTVCENPSLTREGKGVGLRLSLLGTHQLNNAAAALLAIEELNKQGMHISAQASQQGLVTTRWPGRLEILSEQPFILVDGAHNPASVLALYRFLTDATTKPESYDVLIVGMKNDKDVSVLRNTLAPLFNYLIVTEGTYEPKPAAQLAAELTTPGKPIEIIRDPRAATQRGLERIGRNGSMVITGSLYMIPEALRYLHEKLPARAPETARAAR